jgi:hypothetical protein
MAKLIYFIDTADVVVVVVVIAIAVVIVLSDGTSRYMLS